MNMQWFGITWSGLNYWWVIILLCVALFVIWYRFSKTNRIIALLAGNHPKLLIRNFSVFKNSIKAILLSAAFILFSVALLRPQWSKKEESVAQQARDVFIALDISRSMLAADCAPNRLECAKKKIKSLLSYLSCERVGLILYSGAAFMQCPLTKDYGSFFMFLDQVDVETISSGSTNISAAITEALRAFEAIDKKKNKLLILFTDGEDFSSELGSVKERAKDQNLHVFAIGVGTNQGAPVPLIDNNGKQSGHQKDDTGNIVISRLNEALLKNLATDIGGKYISMTADNSDIEQLVRTISAYEKEELEEIKMNQLHDWYHYFITLGLIALLIEWLL